MFRVSALILSLLVLLSGCTGRYKTKEQLLDEGLKQVQKNNPGGAIVLFKTALDKDQNYVEARFQLAKAYYVIGKMDAAEKELQKVRRQDPSSREARIELARVLAHTNRPDDALKEISQYLGDSSTDCDALDIAGWAHAVKNDTSGAVTLLKRAVTACGERSAPTISLSIVYAMMGDMQEAEKQITSVLEKEPTNRKALYLLAEIQTSRNDGTAALQTLDRVLQINPNDLEAQYRKGLLYIEIKDYDNARIVADAMIKQFPKRAESHRLQGFVYYFKQQYVDAIPALQRSLVMQPNAGTYYILGLSHYYRNEKEQAINQFQKALEVNPSLIQARVQLALLLLQVKRTDDAIKEVKTALAQDDQNAMAHNVLGSAYLTKGNYAEGLTELNKALELDPSLAEIHLKKGLVAMKRGRSDEAESELISAVSLRPEAQDMRRVLALYYINRNEAVKALDVLKQGLQGGSSDAVSYYLMGEVYLRQNNLSEARVNYQKAKDADPKYDPAYFRLASLDLMQQKQDDGIKEIRGVLEKEPGNVQAMLLLASLAEMNSNENEARKNYLAAADTGKAEGIIPAALYLQRMNDADKAISVLNEGINKAPTDIRLLELKGRILLANKQYNYALSTFEAVDRINHQIGLGHLLNTYIAMGKQAKALEMIQAEIKGNPTNVSLRAELSRIYLLQGNRNEAIANSRDIITKNPDSPVGYLTLVMVYEGSNDVDKAIEVLKSLPKTQSAKFSYTLGNLYARKKNYVAALEQYREAEKIDAGSSQVLFMKGSVFDAMGKKKDAADEYQKAVRLSPNNAMALNNLAYLYAEENKNLSQALVFATHALMLQPQNDFIRDTLGYVLLKNGRIDQGLIMLKKAWEGKPNNPSICYHLALAYKENGDSVKAAEYIQKALELGDFPEAHDAKILLGKMKKSGDS
jgi:putative PEP-CTERM system TPR-repeat lipoprotein